MTNAPFTDEMLMAYADGEADEATAAAIETAMADDEALAEKVALFADSRRLAKAALPLSPVPAGLEQTVRRMLADAAAAPAVEKVIPFRRPDTQRPAAAAWRLPLAASIALVAGAIGGWVAGQLSTPSPAAIGITTLEKDAVLAALSTVPSGEERALDGGRFRAIASFADSDGRLCREFEVDGQAGALVSVACRTNGRWDVRFAVATATAGDGYAPASSLEALDAFLAASGAGEPMGAEAEAKALSDLSL